MGLINTQLARLFYILGYKIAERPKHFIITPLIIVCALSTGLLHLKYTNDVEYLYTPTNGESKTERLLVEKLFPMNNSARFDPSRLTKIGRFARVIITAQDGDTLIREKVWKEIQQVDQIIHNATIEWKGLTENYTSLCARWHEDCYENQFLELGDLMEKFEGGTIRLSYPIMFMPTSFKVHVLPQYFGGVTLKEDQLSVDSVKAVLLNYFIAVDTEEDDARGGKWELEILRRLQESGKKFQHITVYQLTFQSFADESEANVFSIVPHFIVTVFIMGIFTVTTSMTSDWVTSKPWLGVMGVLSAGMGTLAGGGILCFIGVPVTGINMAVPFLMIGIGLDDTFVMLASWRRTSPKNTVPERLAEAYSEAAVSITITTLTDMLSFYVGILTPIPCVQIFSIYAGTCILGIYICQVFFFGGVMAVSGYHEAANRHSVLWWIEAIPKSKAAEKPALYRFFFTGGYDKATADQVENTDNGAMAFFRDSFSSFLFKPWVKIGVIITFLIYIGISVYGVTKIEEGLRRERIARYDSYMSHFIEKENEYFKDYPYRMQIIINTPLDYSDKETQNEVNNIIHDFNNITLITHEYSENWLRDFTTYVDNYKEFLDFNITNEADFVSTLQSEFLNPRLPISLDVAYNANKTKILATRYIVQIIDARTSLTEKQFVEQSRAIAKSYKNVNVTIYHPWFHFIDQFIIIQEQTFQLIIVAAIIVMFIAGLFIPNIVCSVCVLFTIASIELGVLGFMSLWSVNLDLISIICLIMCIGFSVDFSAHISYAYIAAEGETSEDRIRAAMYSLGLPIVQGAVSTIVGICTLCFANAYIFEAFFKIVVLVIFFAGWHALFLLPVLLLLFRPENGLPCSKRKSYTLDNSFQSQNNNKVMENNNIAYLQSNSLPSYGKDVQ